MRITHRCFKGLLGLTCASLLAAPALADEVAAPWGTLHGNYAGTQSSDAPSMVFDADAWANGAVESWSADVRAMGLDRSAGRNGIVFDEDGNLYWKTSSGGSLAGQTRMASFDQDGNMRWIAGVGGTPDPLGVFDGITPVVGDGGQSGRVYILGEDAGAGFAAAYNKSDGERVWKTPLPGSNFGTTTNDKVNPVLYNGKLFVIGMPTANSLTVYQLDSATGAIDWSNAIGPVGNNRPSGHTTMVADAFGAGKHGLYYNTSSGNGTDGIGEIYGIEVDTVGSAASLSWQSDGGHVGRSHVIYVEAAERVCTHTWTDYGAEFYCWNLDGTDRSAYNNFVNSGHGFYDVGMLDFNGTDVLAGGFDGRIIRYQGIMNPTLDTLYDSGGFEALSTGSVVGQDGWIEDTSEPGMDDYGEVQVVDDPTGSSMGKVLAFDAPGTAGGWLGTERAIGPTTKGLVTIEWDQWRADTNDNFWMSDGLAFDGWYAIQWDSSNAIHAETFGPSTPLTAGVWQHVKYTFDTAGDTVTVDVDGNTASGTLTDDVFAAITFENEPTAAGGEGGPIYIDNLVIKQGDPAVAGDGYYQLTSWFGEPRVFGGLYKDQEGNSILVTATNSRSDLDPTFSSRVLAMDATNGNLIDGCEDFDDAPAYIDNFKITGGTTPDPGDQNLLVDAAGFAGYALGVVAGQGNPGGTGTLTWTDNLAAPGGTGGAAIIADPTGSGKGNVLELDVLNSCGGHEGIIADLAAAVGDADCSGGPGNCVVNVEFEQYRQYLSDNLWLDDSDGGWGTLEWDSPKGIFANEFVRNECLCDSCTNLGAFPLTRSVWQKIRYEFDFEFDLVSLYVDDVCVGEADLADDNLTGFSWRLESTATSESAGANTPTIFEYATGIIANHAFTTRGGPVLAPKVAGKPQQIVYFNNNTGALVAIKPNVPVTPLELSSAVSRKTHTGAGDFDIDLPLSGCPGIESRTGASATVVLTLSDDVVVTDGTLECGDEVTVAGGTCDGVSLSGAELTVTVGVTNATVATISLSGLEGVSATALSGDADVEIGVLAGDATADRVVNIIDLNEVKGDLFAAVVAGNFRSDVNGDGVINIIDLNDTKGKLFTTLPACP